MSESTEMSCRELVELITEYLEGTLPPPARVRFEEHLKVCPHCRTYLEQMHQVIHTLGTLTEETIAHDAKQELLEAFRNWKRS